MGIFVCLTYDSELCQNQTDRGNVKNQFCFTQLLSSGEWSAWFMFKTNKRSLNQMYDVPSMCSTLNRKTNSFKDNVNVQNSKTGNSPRAKKQNKNKQTKQHPNQTKQMKTTTTKINNKTQKHWQKTTVKTRTIHFFLLILFSLTRRSRFVRKYKLW